jgi:hypothetical protein
MTGRFEAYRPMRPVHHVCLMLAAAAVACGDGGTNTDNPGGLVRATAEPPAAIDLGRAATSATALGQALAVPYDRVGALLGPHHLRATTRLRVTAGGAEVEAFTEDTEVFLGAGGALRAVQTNSNDTGREVVYRDGVLYLRPRYGVFHRRPPTDDSEPAALLADLGAGLGDAFELVAPAVALVDRGESQRGATAVRTVELGLADRARPRHERLTQRAWRETATVQSASGSIALDVRTGVAVEGKLLAEVAFNRDGTEYVMTIEHEHTVDAVGEAAPIEPPADSVTVADRFRTSELAERDQLLEGIAAPADAVKPKPLPEGEPRIWRKRQKRAAEAAAEAEAAARSAGETDEE